MSKARLVITAVVVEGRTHAQAAADYGVSRSWVTRLVARWRLEGDAAFEPRSRRPNTSPGGTDAAVVELICEMRRQLTAAGLDAGPDTIRWHLGHHHGIEVSASTIRRRLVAAGLVVPEPRKRPKSSYVRFEADLPNEMWQADMCHWRLAGGSGAAQLRDPQPCLDSGPGPFATAPLASVHSRHEQQATVLSARLAPQGFNAPGALRRRCVKDRASDAVVAGL